jgi:hypothetical protein
MKEFRKTKNGLFVCEECGQTFIRKNGLVIHLNKQHKNVDYFNKWLKDNLDGFCKVCNKSTQKHNRLLSGYKNCCSKECDLKYYQLKKEQKFLKKYGVTNYFLVKDFKEKREKTWLENYGVNHIFKNKVIKEKINLKIKEKYGTENPFESEEIKEKIKKILLQKYGVEHPSQNKIIFEKTQKSCFRRNQFKNTELHYQASYELDFLENFYDKFIIENAPSIQYKFNGKNKTYHPDFYIPSLNTIVEIKNSFLAKKDKMQIEEKKKATIANGFKYIIIIDKNYLEFLTSTS